MVLNSEENKRIINSFLKNQRPISDYNDSDFKLLARWFYFNKYYQNKPIPLPIINEMFKRNIKHGSLLN